MSGRHFPPGTSEWNKREPCMVCQRPEHWRGRSWVRHEVVVNLIGHTTPHMGWESHSELNAHSDPTGREVTAQQLQSLSIKQDKCHGEWHYTLVPRS